MQAFLRDSKILLRKMDMLNGYIEELNSLCSRKNNAVLTREEEKRINTQIDVLNDKFSDYSKLIKGEIDRNAVRLEEERNTNADPQFVDTIKIHLCAQSKKYAQAIQKYNETLMKRNDDEVDKFKLQYIIAKPDATEQEIKEVISDDTNTKVASAYALGARSARGMIEEAENRKNNIRKIEKKLEETIDLMNLINMNVARQSQTVETIKINLETGEENVQAANVDLESALASQIRATRIKKFFVTLIILAIIVIVVYLLLRGLRINVGGKSDEGRR
jgi:syntaxin 1B/2/3